MCEKARLTSRPVTESTKDLAEIESLYIRSFPENERRPFQKLLDIGGNSFDLLAFDLDDAFVGFASLLNAGDISHILYFAVEEALRDHGYGSAALAEIARYKKGRRIIVDIERPERDSENPEQREKRKSFYLRNGYKETEIRYRWRGEDYEILSLGGTVTPKEFRQFWDTVEQADQNADGL